MKNFFLFFFIFFMFQNFSFSEEWKTKNKWKISCGLVNKEALVINGKPKKSYSKREFRSMDCGKIFIFLVSGLPVRRVREPQWGPSGIPAASCNIFDTSIFSKNHKNIKIFTKWAAVARKSASPG